MDDIVFDSEDLIAWLLVNGDNLPDDNNLLSTKSPTITSDALVSPTEDINSSFLSSFLSSGVPGAPTVSLSSKPSSFTFIKNEPGYQSEQPSFGFDGEDDNYSESSVEYGESSKRKFSSNHSDTTKSDWNGRKKHKTTPEDLERRMKELEDENMELKAHLSNLAQRNIDKQKQRNMMESLMGQLVSTVTGAIDFDSQSRLDDLLQKYTETYADYGKSRIKEINFHLNQLEKLAVPTTTTKMILWTLQQDKSFVTSPLFDEISANLGLNSEQTEKIQERRQIIKELIKKLRESLDLIKRLRTAISNKHKILDTRLSSIRQIASSRQTVQLIFWISKNSARLQRLIPNFSKDMLPSSSS